MQGFSINSRKGSTENSTTLSSFGRVRFIFLSLVCMGFEIDSRFWPGSWRVWRSRGGKFTVYALHTVQSYEIGVAMTASSDSRSFVIAKAHVNCLATQLQGLRKEFPSKRHLVLQVVMCTTSSGLSSAVQL